MQASARACTDPRDATVTEGGRTRPATDDPDVTPFSTVLELRLSLDGVWYVTYANGSDAC